MLKDYARYLNRTFSLDWYGIVLQVRVEDIKSSYGNVRAQVTALCGTGTHWVDISRLEELK